ncbi:N-acetyltransferase [Shewanella acanthi]|uniref:N-acetyltransferase n=1 Tax=Shewanella acanthi TaxID=2864212 RepID=UPI001C661CFF|nr:N-acetyltransferase [Shewanella acanthi]QYJ79823.1 N-acetyltransferase [Shewanella acanthi]
MDMKMPTPIEFELIETAPLFHELLNLRVEAGRHSIGVEHEVEHQQSPFWICIRMKALATIDATPSLVNSSMIVATACVVKVTACHYAIEDFLTLPAYRHLGLANILLGRMMDFIEMNCQVGDTVSISALGEDELLCAEYGFVRSHCASFGPNLLKRVE